MKPFNKQQKKVRRKKAKRMSMLWKFIIRGFTRELIINQLG